MSRLGIRLPKVDAICLLIQETEQSSGLEERLGTDAELGEDYGADGVGAFGDDLRGRRVEPFVRPALEGIDIRRTKGARTCPP